MNRKVLSVLLSIILVFCGVLFVGCDEDEIFGGSDGGSAELKAKIKEEDKKYSTGNEEYTDTLTFNVTVE